MKKFANQFLAYPSYAEYLFAPRSQHLENGQD